jgi:hypothetical protein
MKNNSIEYLSLELVEILYNDLQNLEDKSQKNLFGI